MLSLKFVKFSIIAVAILICWIFFATTSQSVLKDNKFSISKISYIKISPNFKEYFPKNVSHETIENIFGQPYYYLGKGAQVFAFESADHEYVIKFFKNCRYKSYWYGLLIPSITPFNQYHQSIAKAELAKALVSYKHAYDIDPEGCGLIYVQLSPTKRWNQKLKLYDQNNDAYQLDLNQYRFVLQKKVKDLRIILDELLKDGQIELATNRLWEVITLYHEQYHKGIYDRGVGFMHNNGFIGNRAVHFDAGKIVKDEKIKMVNMQILTFNKSFQRIEKWLKKNYPSYQHEISNNIKRRLNTFYAQNN